MPTKLILKPYTFKAGNAGTLTTYRIPFQQSRTSSGCKDWVTKIAAGESATTSLQAYDRFMIEHRTTDIVLSKTNGSSSITGKQSAYSIVPNQFALSDSLVTNAKAKAYGELNSKAAEIHSEFSAQIFAGELRETVDFLKDPLRSLANLTTTLLSGLVEIKKRPYKAARDTAQAVADVWLAYRFAVLPLLGDVEKICEIIEDTSMKESPNRLRAFGQDQRSTTSVNNNYGTGLNLATLRYEVNTIETAKCIINSGIIMEHHLKQFSEFDGALKRALALNELPTTVWNLIPLSFVADYFANVGSIIEAATQSDVRFAYISETVVRETRVRATLDNLRVSSSATWPKIVSFEPGISHFVHRSVDRSSRTSAIPPLSVSLPGRDIPKLNIAALLTKLLS